MSSFGFSYGAFGELLQGILPNETSMIKHVNHPQIMKTQQQPGITALS